MDWDKEKDMLLESQKTRDSLLKWKLIIIALVGAAGLGLSKSVPVPYSELALCLIPFACCYIDLLCRNLSIRTKMIGKFLANNEEPFEIFYLDFKGEKSRNADKGAGEKKKISSLESFALSGSTYFASLAIIPVGSVAYLLDQVEFKWFMIFPISLFLISGLCGILFSIAIEKQYRKQRSKIYS